MQHHVYFTLKEEHKTAEGREKFEKSLTLLASIKSIAKAGWGKPADTEVRAVSDRTWDYAIYFSFDTLADHDAYQIDADHMAFVEENKEVWESLAVRDID